MKKYLESEIKKRSIIVITVDISKKVAQLYFKKLRFRGVFKVIKKYWKVGPSLIYLSYTKEDNDCLKKYL